MSAPGRVQNININIENLHILESRSGKIENAFLSGETSGKISTLGVDFFGNKQPSQRLIFTVIPTNQSEPTVYGSYLCEVSKTGKCIDVQPINGIAKSRFLKNLFRNSHVKDLESQLDYLNSKNTPGCRVFVLDVKDSKGRYEHEREIEASEQEVIEFGKGQRPTEATPRQQIYDLLQKNHIQYVFLEGKLKNRPLA